MKTSIHIMFFIYYSQLIYPLQIILSSFLRFYKRKSNGMKRSIAVALLFLLFIINTSFFRASGPASDAYYIIIKKHAYALMVYDSKGWLATYPVVFGNKDLKDKMVQGDRETPEGNFRILSKRVHEKWCRMLMLDFPNAESIQKFNIRKQQGIYLVMLRLAAV